MENAFEGVEFKFDESDIERLSKDPTAKPGTYDLLVVQESIFASKEGSKSAGTIWYKTVLSPLKVSGDASSVDRRIRIEHMAAMPLSNPEVEGHKAPSYSTSASNELFAALGLVARLPRYPAKNKEEEDNKKAIVRETMTVAASIVSGALSLKGRSFFATVTETERGLQLRQLSSELGDRSLMQAPFITG